MNIQVGDKVKIDRSKIKVEGIVCEISDDAILLKQKTKIDGKEKIIKQWYDKNMISEILETAKQEEHNEAVDIVEEFKKRGLTDQQIEDLTNDKEAFQDKLKEFGIDPEKVEINEEI